VFPILKGIAGKPPRAAVGFMTGVPGVPLRNGEYWELAATAAIAAAA